MKFKLIARSIQDHEADHVIDLGSMGMSRKLIASEVYGSNKKGECTHSSLMRVHHILRDYGIRVTDYRNGRNKEGKAVIAAIRREAEILPAIRAAQKVVATAMNCKFG